jgi:phage-related protein
MTARRWRDYRTASGRRPIRDFLQSLSDEDAAEVVAAMSEVRQLGLEAARKLRGEIWEVRAEGNHVIHRVLFASDGRRGFILLALVGFTKKTQRTPLDVILLAEQRLADWRSRGQ